MEGPMRSSGRVNNPSGVQQACTHVPASYIYIHICVLIHAHLKTETKKKNERETQHISWFSRYVLIKEEIMVMWSKMQQSSWREVGGFNINVASQPRTKKAMMRTILGPQSGRV